MMEQQLRYKYAALIWFGIVLIFILVLCYLLPSCRLNTSIIELLPKQNSTQKIKDAEIIGELQQRLDKQLIWLIKPDQINDLSSIQWFYQKLQSQNFIATVQGEITPDFQTEWSKFAFQYRYLLIDQNTQQRLKNNEQLSWILSQLYNPFGGVNVTEITNDPLLLTRAGQLNQNNSLSKLQLTHNWLSAIDKHDQIWFIIYAELKQSSFNLNQTHESVIQLNRLIEEFNDKWPNNEILTRGILFYSDYASSQAQDDIETIGTLSFIGITLLVLSIFRSIKPLLLTLLSISVGLLIGLVAVLISFKEIHLFTLVMSTSIVGIAEDYATHYLVERMLHGNQETARESLKKLQNTFIIALLTSLIAYIILLITPFPGLQQLAIFAIFGLIATFFTVICWYPFLVNRLPVREKVAKNWLTYWLNLWQYRSFRWAMIVGGLFFIILGSSQIEIDDDISRLQTMPEQLKQQEQQIAAITEQQNEQKWLLVYGTNPEQTLQRLEELLPTLDNAKKQQWITQYQTINLPSLKKQQEQLTLIKQTAPKIIDKLIQMGLVQPSFFTQFKATLESQELIYPNTWLESPYSFGWRLLWITSNNKSATLIPLNGVNDTNKIRELISDYSGVVFVNNKADYDEMFHSYRIQLSYLLTITIIFICITFFIKNYRYSLKFAFLSCIPTLFSIGSAFALLGFSGQPFNLFSLLAFILVIGMGIDYSLFMSNSKSITTSSFLAVFMAAISTFLSFGLLTLSHTSAIASFGFVIAGGLIAAFLFSPLAIPPKVE
ncbi:MMPL family transporter [Orbaceae bacterium ESL0721]|nr:MMPL family transporter [Orbaceae bacterium ESL0721]